MGINVHICRCWHKFPHKIKRNQSHVELWPYSRKPKILRLQTIQNQIFRIFFQREEKSDADEKDDDGINQSSSQM